MTINKIKSIVYRLLRRSEKYTGTDMVYLAKGGFWVTMISTVFSFNAFAIALAFANLVPKEIYGQYKYALAVFAILKLFTLEDMGPAIVRAIARGYEGVLKKALAVKIKWGLIGSAISIAVCGYYFYTGNNVLAITFLIIGVFIPIFENPDVYIDYFNGKKQFAKLSKRTVALEILTTIILIITLFLTNNFFIILISYLLSYTAIRLLFLFLFFKKSKLNSEVDNNAINYGKHLSLMEMAPRLSMQTDALLLWHFFGAAQLAIYAFAVAIPNQIKSMMKFIKVIALPKMSANDPAMTRKYLSEKVLKGILITVPICLAYIFTAPVIFKMLFPQYLESVIYTQIASILIVTAPQTLYLAYLQSQARKKQLYFLNIFTSVIRISLLGILTPFFGIMGAVLAIVVTQLTNFGLLHYFVKIEK